MGVVKLIKSLLLLAVSVAGGAVYPVMPLDKTTPVQQRIAINGPNSMSSPLLIPTQITFPEPKSLT